MSREVYERLAQILPDALQYQDAKDPAILVKGEHLLEVAQHLKKERYDYLSAVTGVDYHDRFEVVYHLYSLKDKKGPLILKVSASKEEPKLPSVTSLWPGADFQEREVYDLMGIHFSGHPNLKRILLWEGYDGYPLRKDFPIEGRKGGGLVDGSS